MENIILYYIIILYDSFLKIVINILFTHHCIHASCHVLLNEYVMLHSESSYVSTRYACIKHFVNENITSNPKLLPVVSVEWTHVVPLTSRFWTSCMQIPCASRQLYSEYCRVIYTVFQMKWGGETNI